MNTTCLNSKDERKEKGTKQGTETPVLSWDLDPEESFSDWKIEIIVNDEVQETFYVHRAILAVGARSSKYFRCLFRQPFQESSTKTSRIKLDHDISVKAFPQLLDYLYNLPFKVETESAIALHSLSQYFEVEQLKLAISHFCEKDIDIKNFTTYYNHAKLLLDDAVLDKVLIFCLKNLNRILKDPILAQSLSPELWLEAFKKTSFIFVEDSKSASIAVARSLKGSEELITKDMYEELTNKKFLPYIHHKATYRLMEMEFKLCAPPENGKCTFLQERCIYSLAENWKSIDHERIKKLSKKNHLIGSKLLQKVSMAAQDEAIPPPIEEGPAIFDFSRGENDSSPFGKSTFNPFGHKRKNPCHFGNLESSTPEVVGEEETK